MLSHMASIVFNTWPLCKTLQICDFVPFLRYLHTPVFAKSTFQPFLPPRRFIGRGIRAMFVAVSCIEFVPLKNDISALLISPQSLYGLPDYCIRYSSHVLQQR